jgi:hypothetical protein
VSLSHAVRFRLRAFALHLAASLVVIGLFLLLLQIWYPGPFFEMESAWRAVRVVIGVQLVLGPLLTLLVFDYRKAAHLLRLDLTVIIALQLAALGWGAWSSYTARPAYLVYSQGLFQTVSPGEVDASRLTVPSLASSVMTPPQMVYALPPQDDAEGAALFTALLRGEAPDIPFLAERYRPLPPHLDELRLQAQRNAQLLQANPAKWQAVGKWLSAHGGTLQEYGFFPVFGHKKEGVAVVHLASGALVGYLDMVL